ncbi:MAG: hypothetical protein RL411_483 [Bacteroidota bacterium]|jgi:hypothetical protein
MKTAKILFTISAITATMFFASCEPFSPRTVIQEISQTIQNDKADSIHVKTIIVRLQSGNTSTGVDTSNYSYSLASGENKSFKFQKTLSSANSNLWTSTTFNYYFEVIDSKGKRDLVKRTIATKDYVDTKISETIVITD